MYDRIRGVLDQPVGEGTHFRVPWLQTPNIMDIRTRPRTISSVTGTKGKVSTQPARLLVAHAEGASTNSRWGAPMQSNHITTHAKMPYMKLLSHVIMPVQIAFLRQLAEAADAHVWLLQILKMVNSY